MFTGIIRHLGTIQEIRPEADGTYLTITTDLASQAHTGDSIAVNGTCLTVLRTTADTLLFRLMQETLNRTNLSNLKSGIIVNLEQPVAAGERFDGHFVQGHVDGVVTVTNITSVGADRVFTFQPSVEAVTYLVPKGSIALDGVSLTIVDVHQSAFTVSMMPYTIAHTNFSAVTPGYEANVEFDMIAKHIGALLQAHRHN